MTATSNGVSDRRHESLSQLGLSRFARLDLRLEHVPVGGEHGHDRPLVGGRVMGHRHRRVTQGGGDLGEQGEFLLGDQPVEGRDASVGVVRLAGEIGFELIPKEVEAGAEHLPFGVTVCLETIGSVGVVGPSGGS